MNNTVLRNYLVNQSVILLPTQLQYINRVPSSYLERRVESLVVVVEGLAFFEPYTEVRLLILALMSLSYKGDHECTRSGAVT